LTLVPGLLAALAIALLVHEGPHAPQPHARLWTGMTGLPAEFRKFLVGVGLAGLGDFSNTLLILWATQAFRNDYGIERAATLAVLLYLGYNVVYMMSCYVSGMLADRFSKKWLLAIGYALAVVPAALLLSPGDSIAKFAMIFGFSGLYMGVWETTESSTAATLLPAQVRGVGFGTLAAVNGIGDVIASVAVGFLWNVSPAWAMSFVMAASVAGAIVIASTHPPPRVPSS
jgi:MFS family permease